ncbi:MAG: aspartate aminotransferase family protein [Deinococcaceae bacterium]
MTQTKPNWLALELQYDSRVYAKHPLVIVKGKGALVWDVEGREYIDCVAGYGVANVGHSNPEVVAAIQHQAETLMVLPQSIPNDKRAEFLSELTSVLPGLDRVFLCNSGTEAMEAAMKFAMVTTQRRTFVAMEKGFSGRTLGAVSLTWEPKYRAPFAPSLAPVCHVPYGDLERLAEAVDDQTAAVILELVQGEGGVRPVDPQFVREARRITREKGALLIFDEIQTGFCRTGKMFAADHVPDVQPDGMTLAKAMAGGVPIGAFAMTSAVADSMPVGGHGTTFGGNPLAMAAGVAAIRFMTRETLWEQAAEKGQYFIQKLSSISSPKIKEVRGQGLMVGVELNEDSAPYIAALEEKGVLALQATANVIRFLPPLTISLTQLDQVVQTLEDVLS